MGKRKNKQLNQNPKNLKTLSPKEKKMQQKKSQDTNEFNLPQDRDTFKLEINQLKEQALKEHNEASKIAKKSYGSLMDSVNQSDIILQVLDARDPHGSRIIEIEKLIKEKGKQLINIINKVDLIPQEVALRWLGDPSFQIDELSQLITFNDNQDQNIIKNFPNCVKIAAITSKTDSEQQNSWNVLREVISAAASSLQQPPIISVIGINQVGKSTICSFLNANNNGNFSQILEVPSYTFITSTDTAAILSAIDYIGEKAEFWFDFASRCQDESIFDVLGIEPTNNIQDVIKQYAKVIHKSVTDATNEILNNLLNGSQPFFSVPEDTPAENISEPQQIILNSLTSIDNESDAIHINRGDPLEIDDDLLH